jgi:SAM-dependent methyltransferase
MNRIYRVVKDYLLREQFNPSVMALFFNPFYFARKAIYRNVKSCSKSIGGITLDVGCGSKPYKNLFSSEKYIGMDIRISGHDNTSADIDVYYDGTTIPFQDASIDSIVCFEVLEHVFNPEVFMSEINRVLKKGGTAIFTVPFIWDEHEQPYDYARYSSFGLRHIFNRSGFIVVYSKKYICDLTILPLLANAYIFKILKKLIPNKLSYIFILPLTSINNILGHLLYLFPKNNDLYYGNIFLLKKH